MHHRARQRTEARVRAVDGRVSEVWDVEGGVQLNG